MKEILYIPVHSMNLAHYLGAGIITPSIYIENKNVDIQDKFNNYLLFSTSKFTIETNCAIEVILSEQEKVKQISNDFYLYDKPLPISRIKNIYFTSEEQKASTYFNITSGTAFIPEDLFKVSKDELINSNQLENINYPVSEKDWSKHIRKYDRILGGFAVMRASNERFQNYPTHYFSTLGNINSFFISALKEQKINIENNFEFAFSSEGKFKDFHNTIYNEINHSEVQEYAEKDKVKLEIKNGIIQIDKIPENKQTYLVAILDSYGKNKRKHLDSFFSDLAAGKFIDKKREGLSLIFGINKGYKAFRNKYKTENFEVDIKFHIDSKLDYYIIESIYQNVFNHQNNIDSFQYIDNNISNCEDKQHIDSKYITYQIIDKTIIWKEKVLTPLEKLLSKIVNKISNWFPNFIEIKKNELEIFFKDDIEFYTKSIEKDIENKFRVEIEQNKSDIESLKRTILDKESTITYLQNQLKEVQKSNIDRGNSLLSNTNDATIPEKMENDVNNFDVKTADTSISMKKLREAELINKKKLELKVIAESCGLKIKTRATNAEIIDEIIKHEFFKK